MNREPSHTMRYRYFALVAALLAGIFTISAGRASPATSTALSGTHAAQAATGCAAFNSRVWAQTVYDEDPGKQAALDPDDDGLACEELPPGIAPALWTDDMPAAAIPVDLAGVIDGDTIEVSVDGRLELVRLVGIDAQEAGGPYQEVECYGPAASDFLRRLLGIGGTIALEADQEDRDPYGRMLRWVWADFGTGEVYLLNEALVRAGFAERFRNTPNRRYVDELIEAEAFARRHELGLWGACDGDRAGAPAMAEPTQLPDAACDPAYPDVCIPSPPPDLACGDVPYERFRVLPPDPHHFDGNRDGVACEGPG